MFNAICSRLPASSTPRVRVLSAIATGTVLLFGVAGCGNVPQVVDDEAVFGEVDALYTAVTSKRPQLLADCRTRLTKLHQEQRLSDSGFETLTNMMETCEEGDWDSAAHRLYDFMRAQRKTVTD